MNCPLGIVTPDLGASIATFIKRHAMDILPGATAVAGTLPATDVPLGWQPQGPSLDLAHVGGRGLGGRCLRAVARGCGVHVEARTLTNFFRRHDVAVVMGEYLDFSSKWLEASRQAGCRFFAHAHGHDVSARLREERWRSAYLRYREADGVITINESSRRDLIALGLPENKVHLVHYGVPVASEIPERDDARQGDRIGCLAAGRMVPQKAPIMLLDAFRRAAEQESRLHLDYIGAGPLLPEVKEYILTFRLADKVTLHGWKHNAEVRDMMSSAAMFLQHSMTDPHTGDQEGLPLAILEAMAEGLPVVSTLHAGIPEAVQDGVTGHLVSPGDTVGMAERILRLAGSVNERKQFGEAAHVRARALFSWQRERARLLQILGLRGAA